MKTFKTLLAALAVLLCSISARAHDFEVDGIYYNVTSSTERTVEVTFRPIAQIAGWNVLQSLMYTGDLSDSNV